jgi:hypothetical protein
MGLNIETDELAFFPFLYWPITADQPLPSREAYGKLNRYLRSGGMILFDTRDADTARFGSGSPEGARLQAIARSLDIPPLEPIPDDHVLTRTFYLLQDFPGRYASRDVWVEAAPPDAEQVEGMPFRNLNDGVTPVVIGSNDWASAWATDGRGGALFPVGRGFAGERQRELAYRFGVNLIMHVLTGNYKSDQVHVPALLDRLGQCRSSEAHTAGLTTLVPRKAPRGRRVRLPERARGERRSRPLRAVGGGTGWTESSPRPEMRRTGTAAPWAPVAAMCCRRTVPVRRRCCTMSNHTRSRVSG